MLGVILGLLIGRALAPIIIIAMDELSESRSTKVFYPGETKQQPGVYLRMGEPDA